MTENAKKIFEMLGVEPNERFKIQYNEKNSYYIGETLYYINENLIICNQVSSAPDNWLQRIIVGELQIVKLPRKKKLRDLTPEEYKKWYDKNCGACGGSCCDCLFNCTACLCGKYCWVNHKDLYSDKFLDQEVEIPIETEGD